MAQRRMFSLKIVDTDDFLNMPSTTRLLYYDFAMRADDDGFVSSPQKIAKITGATSDDFKLLCSKNYLIPFQSGVCVIKDWRVHNYIQSDRYQKTMYAEEKRQLVLQENGMYTKCIQNVSKTDTQVRLELGEDSLGKDRVITHTPQPKVADKKKKKDFVCYSEDFESAWAYYPTRLGSNSKITAFKEWCDRVATGVLPEDLIAATVNYQRVMTNTKSIGTPYVMQSQRFYGKAKEYERFLNIKVEELSNERPRKPSSASEHHAAVCKFLREM